MYISQVSGERLQDHWSSGFSVLSMKDFPNNYNFAENNLSVGDKVVAYPYNVSNV